MVVEVDKGYFDAPLGCQGFETVEVGDVVEGTHQTATAAGRIDGGVVADDGNAFDRGGVQGQDVRFVLEQDDTLAGNLESRLCRLGVVEGDAGVELFAVEEAEANHRLQNMFHLEVDFTHLYLARSEVFAQVLFVFDFIAGHLQVEPVFHGRDAVVGRAPVRHDESVEAPLLAQHLFEQPRVFGGPGPVEQVVAAHYGTHLGILHGRLEGREIDFVQGALVDVGAHVVAVILLKVGGKVLDDTHYPVGL